MTEKRFSKLRVASKIKKSDTKDRAAFLFFVYPLFKRMEMWYNNGRTTWGRKQMKIFYRGAVLLLCVCLAAGFAGCKKAEKEPEESTVERLDYSTLDLSQYIRLGTYTGLSVAQKEGQSAGDAVWQAVAAECEILRYPEEQVAYYAAQTRAKYRYYARENDLEYGEVLTLFETTEEEIEAQARALVAEDLVYRAVAEDAGIEITQEEKDRLSDRYVTKYVEDYGYTRDYVIGNMTDEIVESMRYDKTTEFLITHNTFPGK